MGTGDHHAPSEASASEQRIAPAGDSVVNEWFVTFRAMMRIAASNVEGTSPYYLGQAGLELLDEIEALRHRLVGMDHDLSATVAERDEAVEERDAARAELAAVQPMIEHLRDFHDCRKYPTAAMIFGAAPAISDQEGGSE